MLTGVKIEHELNQRSLQVARLRPDKVANRAPEIFVARLEINNSRALLDQRDVVLRLEGKLFSGFAPACGLLGIGIPRPSPQGRTHAGGWAGGGYGHPDFSCTVFSSSSRRLRSVADLRAFPPSVFLLRPFAFRVGLRLCLQLRQPG
jgi:hypothetical protein